MLFAPVSSPELQKYPKISPKSPPKTPHETPKTPQDPPEATPEHPETPPEGLKRAVGALQGAKPRKA